MLMYWRLDCGKRLLLQSQRLTSLYIHSKSHFVSNLTHWSSWTWEHNLHSVLPSASEAFFGFMEWYHFTRQIKLDLAKAFDFGRSWPPYPFEKLQYSAIPPIDSYKLFAQAGSDLIISMWSILLFRRMIQFHETDQVRFSERFHFGTIMASISLCRASIFRNSAHWFLWALRPRSKWSHHRQVKHLILVEWYHSTRKSKWT